MERGVVMPEAVMIKKKTIDDYLALPEGARVELINGIMYDMSPAPLRIHQKLITVLLFSIHSFIKKKNGRCEVFTAPFDVRLNDETIVQPDISVICDPTKLTRHGCAGAPDMIVEITSSNYSHDYVRKLSLYYDSGVKEYWIIDPNIQKVTVYLLKDDYAVRQYDFKDDVPVALYGGELVINVSDLLDEDDNI